MGRGMEPDVCSGQLLERPPAVVGVTHVVARLHLTPFVGEQVIDADHIRHLVVKLVEGVGMHHSQRPDLYLWAGFLADFPQDASEHRLGGLQTATDDLPLAWPVPGRRGQQEQAFVCIDDDRLYRDGRTSKAAGALGIGHERLWRGHGNPPMVIASSAAPAPPPPGAARRLCL